MTRPRLHILQDEAALYRACAECFADIAGKATAARGGFHVALSGGSTPAGLYRLLASPEWTQRVDWSRTHVWFGDERCVPPDHADSNFRLAQKLLLAHVPVPPGQVHRLAGEQPPAQAAAAYARSLDETLPHALGLPRLDLVLLGLGPDGHIASLFPGTAALDERAALATAVFVPRLEAWRLSLTLPVLENARHVMLMVAGAGKAEVVRQALCESVGAEPLPVQRLQPRGDQAWFLDAAAARDIDGENCP